MKSIIKIFGVVIAAIGLLLSACGSKKNESGATFNEWKVVTGTSELIINVSIDGQEYTREQLERYEYSRTLQMLHKLKYLGADVSDNGKVLSHEDLNWLEPYDAKRICYDTRLGLDEEGVYEVLKDVFEDSDRRWKKFNEVDIMVQGVQTCTVDFTFTGIILNPDLTFSNIADSTRKARFSMFGGGIGGYLMVHPEHLYRGIEAMGTIGEPVRCAAVPLQEIPEYVPIKKDPSYPICGVSEVNLKSDGKPMHMGAIHEFKPFENGFHMKSTFFCPNNAPKAMSEGHKLHFALEIINDLLVVHEELNTL
jgi:hypothetical protein